MSRTESPLARGKGDGGVRQHGKDGRIRKSVAVPADNELLAAEGKTGEQTFTANVWQDDEWFVAQALEIDVASQGQDGRECPCQPPGGLGTPLRTATSTLTP